MSHYELRCRECGRTWGNQPRSVCDECFSPLEVAYDYDALKASVSRELICARQPNMWRYSELLPLPQSYSAKLPVGFTPLFNAPRLAEKLSGTAAAGNLYIKNDAVCLPTLSFKDRVVAVALSQARAFGFDTVSCSSTGNLANAVAALSPFFGPPQATLLGRRERADSLHAALLNGISSHVLDFDDTHIETAIHLAAPVAPAACSIPRRVDMTVVPP